MKVGVCLLVLFANGNTLLATELQEAEAALRDQRHEQAIELFRAVLVEKPDSYEGLFGLARAYAFSGRHADSLEIYNKLDALHADNADVLLGRGRVHQWLGDLLAAENDLKKALELAPAYADAWAALGRLYMQSDRREEAQRAFEKWAELSPDDPEAQRALSQAREEAPTSRPPQDILTQQAGAENWRLRSTLSITDYDSSRDNWVEIYSSLMFRHESGSLAVEQLTTRRFDDWDDAVGLDLWQQIGPTTTLHLNALVGLDPDIIARWDTLVEAYQDLGGGWELGGGYRHMDYSRENVDTYILHAGKYIGPWYLRYRASFTPSESLGVNHFMAVRYYFNDEDFFEAFGSCGQGDSVVGPGDIRLIQTRTFGGRLEKFVCEAFAVNLGVSYYEEDPGPMGTTYSIGCLLRW